MVDLMPLPAEQFARGPASVECVLSAASRFGLPGNVLLALASNEMGRNGEVVRNTKSPTSDVGHFQVNTETFRRELAPLGIALEDVRWKGCFNAQVAAYLLAKRLDEVPNGDYWTRVSNYHSRTAELNARYRQRLRVNASAWAAWLSSRYDVHVSYR